MRTLLARAKALLEDHRGSFLIEYSSLVLLLAIAAIALVAEMHGNMPT
jgi:Flp pilus assembly pilin Flp